MEILTPYRIVKSKDESVTSGDVMWLSENLDLNSLNEQDGCRGGVQSRSVGIWPS